MLSLDAAGAAAAAGAAGAAGAGAAVAGAAEPALTTASITWSDRPAFFRPISPWVLASNFVWLDLIFEMMIESERPAFFIEMIDWFVSTSFPVTDLPLHSATPAST